MGNILSNVPTREQGEENESSYSETMSDSSVFHDAEEKGNDELNTVDNPDEEEARKAAKEEEMNEFRKQLGIKREQRKEILARHRLEKEKLEKSLQNEQAAKLELCESNKLLCELLTKNNIEIPDNLLPFKGNCELSNALVEIKEEFDILKSNNLKLRKDLSETNRALQHAYSDIADLNGQNIESMKQIQALKEVVAVSKTMIGLREQQLNDLKDKLHEIERTLADRETNVLSADLRQEYERQLQNIRTLRVLYEERARLAEVSRQGLVRELDEHKVLHQAEVKKSKELTEKVDDLESRLDALLETINNKNSQISLCQKETNELKAEMAVVNKLFSQVLLGYTTNQDLDTLVQRLEENHGLLTQMAEKDDGSEASTALPKLLLELVSQVDQNETDEKQLQNIEEVVQSQDPETQKPGTTAEEIVENLPKVWKVLIELLSHHDTSASDVNPEEKVTTCYKSVETKSGPVLVPSVSQTYIRLKDLILEKLGLIKEVNRMKQLNSHLEVRLGEQERRLCLVTNELSKTWHVVGRLRRHHHQLHTHEKILKYELQQKRKLLNELKEELEYCREKWEQAREKNTQSEKDWKELRSEFTSRKTKLGSPSFNNSGESGYSDERPSDESSESNDESEYAAEPLLRCMKKFKKSFDSSADLNLAAEREDPASDMLDVADLPLDTQENEEDQEVVSQACKSEPISKLFEETEDEVCDITQDDSCPEEASIEDPIKSQSDPNTDLYCQHSIPTTSKEEASCSAFIAPAEILRNIQLQNKRLAIKDEKFKHLENNSAALLKKTQMTTQISEEINNTLEHIINRPTSSYQVVNINSHEDESATHNVINDKISQNTQDLERSTVESSISTNDNLSTAIPEEENESELSERSISDNTHTTDSDHTINNPENDIPTPMPDFKAILESVKKQNERLAKKDERLQNLESECSKVLDNISNTIDSSEQIIEKLDTLHQHAQAENITTPPNTNEDKDDATPSSSNEVDHEARFAARDLRLKRLEEQTKSLVNKVNKTTTKGVKIHYKLEELHNIYGSESSRAGTPSEENEDKNNDNESQDENNDSN